LCQSSILGAAQSGAVCGEAAPKGLNPEALATALLTLSLADRARLAAVLLAGNSQTTEVAERLQVGPEHR
jgi:hypothetical protein